LARKPWKASATRSGKRYQKKVPGVWRRRALALAERFPLSRLHPGALARAENGPWAVGFSGGPDSLALLLLLWAHWPVRRRSLVALHFDHDLRGAASRRDARFCARVCRGLGIRFKAERWSRPTTAKPSEAAAREARLAFFDRATSQIRATALWLGHQQDDIAETMFMRVARGSGTAGLAAPRPVTEVVPLRLRPLLTLKKSELSAALDSLGIPFCEDETNRGGDYLRNRMRGEVIPAWLEVSGDRDALAGAALARELLQEDDEALETLTDLRRPLSASGRLDLTRLAGAPRAIWRRALHRWVVRQNARGRIFSLSRAGFTLLLEALMMGRATRISMGANAFAVIAGGRLVLRRGKAG